LGSGRGYDPDARDEEDNGGRLWKVLRDPTPEIRPRHAPAILREAAELVSRNPSPARYGPMRFSASRFADYLARRGIPWPRLPSGALALDDDSFRDMARLFPDAVGPIR